MVSGTAQCESAIRSGKACLVILSEEASDATVEKFTYLCKMRNINAIVIGTKQELGGAIGKGSRTLLAITDEAFKELLFEEYLKIQHGGDDDGKNQGI
ncbi:MAG TPA: 50S ribosomal protein L7ae [Clostridiales bacterium]|jgi:ribosomal protein L7Ae-like RNA K-turn-binding protein|nr:50S ribosomal protein L7ae [Clostridiales bacterium]